MNISLFLKLMSLNSLLVLLYPVFGVALISRDGCKKSGVYILSYFSQDGCRRGPVPGSSVHSAACSPSLCLTTDLFLLKTINTTASAQSSTTILALSLTGRNVTLPQKESGDVVTLLTDRAELSPIREPEP